MNYKCGICKENTQKKFNADEEFVFCIDCKKVICPECVRRHKHTNTSPISQLYTFEQNEFSKNRNNNLETEKIEEESEIESNNNNNNNDKGKEKSSDLYKPSDDDIQTLKKTNWKIKNKIKSLRLLLKMNEILIGTYERYPDNYVNNKNIINVCQKINSFTNDDYSEIDEIDIEKKYKLLRKVPLSIINTRFNTSFNGYEKEINLSNKVLTNNDLKLLSLIKFPKLEELILKNNNIESIDTLQYLTAPNLYKLDLSYNKITDISSLRNISLSLDKLGTLNLSNNNISNIQILNDDGIFPEIQEINLENNNLNYNSNNVKKIIYKYTKENREATYIQKFNEIYKTNVSKKSSKINLEGCSLGDEGLRLLCNINFNNLQEMNLNDNGIINISYLRKLLVNNPKINIISLQKNNITDISVFNEVDLPQIEEIDLRENDIDDSENMNRKVINKFSENEILLLD